MKEDLGQAVKSVAEFIGCPTDDHEYISRVVEQATLEFMKQHVTKFDGHFVKEKLNVHLGLPKGATGTPKVHEGKVGGYKTALSVETVQSINARWKVIAPVIGFSSYDEMRDRHEEAVELI